MSFVRPLSLARGAALALAGLTALPVVYQVALTVPAWSRRRELYREGREGGATGQLRLSVLVPAHDEEPTLPDTLAALGALDYPPDRFEVVVIADNCTDRTAEVAARAGAIVLERDAPDARGKGQAVAWALDVLAARPDWRPDAVVMLDADCTPTPNLLAELEGRLLAGEQAVQVDYTVDNPDEAWSAALRFAAFTLQHTVRPLGKERLGLSAGLFGTGMAFTRELLERQPWRAFTLAEDGEYYLRLLLDGERVAFVPGAQVGSAMPTELGRSEQQNLRWEAHRWLLLRRFASPLLTSGLRHRDPGRLNGVAELLFPPLSLTVTLQAASLAAGLVLRSRPAASVAASALAGQTAVVVGGLALVGAPPSVYRALARAPFFIAWKLALLARVSAGKGPTDWVRTER